MTGGECLCQPVSRIERKVSREAGRCQPSMIGQEPLTLVTLTLGCLERGEQKERREEGRHGGDRRRGGEWERVVDGEGEGEGEERSEEDRRDEKS